MAATFHWCEENGAATGSPAHGTTRNGFGADTNYPTNCNWKTADDLATAASAAKINRPDCSYEKFQYGKFTGTFNSIFNCKWTCNNYSNQLAGLDAYIKLMAAVTSTYTTPSRSVNTALTEDFTEQVWVHRGIPVKFSTSGPEGASPTDTLTAAGYTQYLVSQLQVGSSATYAGGNTNDMYVVLVWEED